MAKLPAVDVRRVKKCFRQGGDSIHALRDVSLRADTQELVMIVGPSGCGKTTLLSVIAGTLNADEGEIELFGCSLHLMKENQITAFRRQNIGFIFQQYHLIPTLNCLENAAIPLLLNGAASSIAEEKAVEALEKVGLKGKEKAFPRQLSGGQQQRVAIARALVHDPRLVICDEPTAALDADSGLKVMDLMKELASQEGRSMLVVTHDNRIFHYADRMITMDDGRIV